MNPTDNKRTMGKDKDEMRQTVNNLDTYAEPMQLSCTIGGQTRENLHVPGKDKGVESM